LDRLVLDEIVTGSLHQKRAALQHLANIVALQRLSRAPFDEKTRDGFAAGRFLAQYRLSRRADIGQSGMFGGEGSWQENETILSPL
jgi:hypothetical protein